MCMVSVIVPVYNTETYLSTCLQSLMGQTLYDMEFIIVDDGSTDSSVEIMDDFACRDSRFKIIRQANKGLGNARNAGLEVACGKYIAFVDSDDWVIYKSYERLVTEAEEYQTDILMAGLVYLYENGRKINPFRWRDKTVFQEVLTGRECFLELSKQHVFNPMVVVCLYRREFIGRHRFRFAPIFHEDALWSPIVVCSALRMKVIDFNFYGYRQHDASITHSKNPERYDSLLYVADKLYGYMQQNFTEEKDWELRYWFYDRLVWVYRFAQSLSNYKRIECYEKKSV
ncbi:glycosyltransferase [Parabacteroides acidifaciens]|uniref:Glycosyltransferase n=1 Tax=Parabacteroides acidifaciens TaxID=2290935 RepID=A0A3D8HDJ1_9BACT|nr:glycosyltransferase [Parabacteroides acidifaciens]MBC8602233.1 glycosyltransferase [Parabacteroides acidifaciens]RDU49044.1 glycosyltransferase [Parabacteroides acidifaciens]